MCRVIINRRNQQQAPPPPTLETSPSLYEAIQALESEEDFDLISANVPESEGELDDEFLRLLNGTNAATMGAVLPTDNTTTHPTACTKQEDEPFMLPTTQPTADINVGMYAVGQPAPAFAMQNMPQPTSLMGVPAAAFPMTMNAAAPPMYSYQMMQQAQAFMQQQQQAMMPPTMHPSSSVDDLAATTDTEAVPTKPTQPRSYKRNKTQEEAAVQEEMVKRRRRESAQRSRQRKAMYMQSLEVENKALKMENDRLRDQLAKMGSMFSMNPAAATTTYQQQTTTRSSSMKLDTSRTTMNEAGMPMEDYLFTMMPSAAAAVGAPPLHHM